MEPGWKTITLAPGLRVRSPLDLSPSRAVPVDSKAALWEGPNLTLMVDQGPYADRLESFQGRGGVVTENEVIGGRSARVVTARLEDGSDFAGAFFDPSEAPESGVEELTVTVTGRDEAGGDVPLKILRSLEFA